MDRTQELLDEMQRIVDDLSDCIHEEDPEIESIDK